jgi:hypothetical protein
MLRRTDLGKDQHRDHILTRRAALMVAAGKSDKEITKTLGISASVLAVWRSSPLWATLVEQYASEIDERGVASVVDELMADAPKNLSFIKQVRNGAFDEPRDRMQLRLHAAKLLLDKQVPNADARAQTETAAKIVLDGRVLKQVLTAMREVGVLDITPEAIAAATAETVPSLIQGKTPEEFAAEYTPPADDDEEE